MEETPSENLQPSTFNILDTVPVKVYDETITQSQNAVHKAKIGKTDKAQAIKKLHEIAAKAEKDIIADNSNENFERLIQKERDESWKYGGKTCFWRCQAAKACEQRRSVQNNVSPKGDVA